MYDSASFGVNLSYCFSLKVNSVIEVLECLWYDSGNELSLDLLQKIAVLAGEVYGLVPQVKQVNTHPFSASLKYSVKCL